MKRDYSFSFLDMVKFRRMGEKDLRNDPLHRWLTWFDRDSPPQQVEEAIKMDKGIQRAEEKMEYVSLDKEALRAYQMREMAMSDWTSGLTHARREGIQEGMQKGMRKIAAAMKRRGAPIDQIAEDGFPSKTSHSCEAPAFTISSPNSLKPAILLGKPHLYTINRLL
ncbi:MAG: Rpn family recombination-promoting nuclease/putative transposase [Spirochaetaceae bacterium]|jgi:predicted transposase/invertase (TIGR01784 family)|nr:Rpn family recombination-promoting nuclease/putative transposase [Spirochaetaceae bacterium]